MFTWICPQCGREVPPAYDDCPDCKARNAQNAQAGGPVPPAPPEGHPGVPQPPTQAPPPPYYQQQPQGPPPPQQYQPPPQAPPRELTGAMWNLPQGHSPAPPPPPPQQQYYQQPPPPGYYGGPQQQPQHGPRRGLNLPIWLMTIVFALAFAGVVLGIVWLMSSNKGSVGTGPAPTATVESPAAKPGTKANPMQKYIEVTGVRFVQDAKKKTQVKFVIVNHSQADVSGLTGNVTVWGRTKKSEEDAQGSFSFSTSLSPYESKELTVPLNSKLKFYELGDWQNITTDVQITAPGA
ncbi:MAG: hypothetical protein JWP63_3655 [Candidatus Solibacter sp.]|nr:hypothetical protein [Candidatus Solibacter sp.]